MRFLLALLIGSPLIAVACNDRHSSPSSSTPSVTPAGTTGPAGAEGALGANAGRATSMGPVTWPKTPPDPKAVAVLPKSVVARVETSPIPVLVPNDASLLAPSTLIVDAAYYAWNSRTGGVTVNVHATRLAFKYDGIPPTTGERAFRGTTGFVTQNEGIYSTSWIENGVSYSLDVECEDHRDARCRDDRWVVELTNALSYVGGKAQ